MHNLEISPVSIHLLKLLEEDRKTASFTLFIEYI